MKLNNKGFAISIILYSMVILIMGVMYLLLSIVNNRYKMNKELKNNVVEYINSQGINTVSNDYTNKLATTKLLTKTTKQNDKVENYYFTGNNPDNYVTFNNESWRIIGIFTIDDIKYLKLIRTNSLKEETLNSNRIINSNLFTYLNNDYYNTIDDSRFYIQKMPFKNAEYSTNRTPYNAYTEEKETSGNLYDIGLIDGSDFGYTSNSTYINNNLNAYSAGINDNWLSMANNYFTMSFYATKVNIVSAAGNLESTNNFKALVYPTVYLKRNIMIKAGTGTIVNPYILTA